MTATKRPQAVPLMQNYLRFLIMGAHAQWLGAKTTTADCRQWAWHVHHRQALRVCAVVSTIIMFLYLRVIEDTPLKLQVYGLILLAVMMAVLTVNRLPLPAPAAANWARQAIMLLSVLQGIVTINIAMGARTPGRLLILFCSWWLDMATNLIVGVPCMALSDMRVKSWLVFLCLHIAVGVPFYVSVQGCSLPLAIFKAVAIQGLSLVTYTAFEGPMCVTYMHHSADASKQGGEALDPTPWAPSKQEQQGEAWGSEPEPQSPSTVSSCSVGKAAGEQPAVGSADSQEGLGAALGHGAALPAGSSAEPPAAEAAVDAAVEALCRGSSSSALALTKRLPAGRSADSPPKGPADLARYAARAPDVWSVDKPQYVSNLRRSTVSIKLGSSFGPEKLPPGAVARLSQRMTSRCPGRVIVDVAVRHGCIMLSMDVCELQRIAQQRSEGQAGPSQHKITQEIIQQWLMNSGLQDILEDGTSLAIQVDGSVLQCTWSARANAWEVSTESLSSSRDLFCIMVPDFVLLFPSQTSLPEGQQQQQQGHHLVPLSPQQQQQQQQQQQEQHGQQEQGVPLSPQQQHQHQHQQLNFKAYISSPSEFQLIGWHGNVEGHTQGGDKSDTLQLLARSQGRFLDIDILHLGARDERGGQSVLACVSLPPDIVACECCQLRLELMRDAALLCNYNTMLVRNDLHPEVQDLKGWAKPPRTPAQISVFVEDLAEYLSFQSIMRNARDCAPAPKSGMDEKQGCSAARKLDSNALLPVLLAEACRPEMLQMMAEVGMDLLQHAVSWGMAHLAERILAGLLAPPLSIPFTAVASYAVSADCNTAYPPAQQSLLLYALLSEDVVMLTRVLEWGRVHGGPGFTWDLEGTGAESDPRLLHLARALPTPQEHLAHSQAASLHQLLSRGGPAAATEAHRVLGAKHGDTGALQLPAQQWQLSGGQTVGSPSSAGATAAAAATPPAAASTTPKSVASPSIASSFGISAAPSSGPSHASSSVQALLPPAFQGNALVSMTRALAVGFGEQGDIKESQYRAWTKACCVGLANKMCIGVVPFFWLQAVLSLNRGLYKSAFTLALYPVPMFMALLSKNPKKREAYMFWAKIFHLFYYIIFGLGLMPSVVARKLAITHLDLIVEVVLCRLMWQVQLRGLLAERAASTIGSSMLYSRLQFQHPLLQALAINFASIFVGIALDVRNRRMYVQLFRAGALPSQRGKKVQ